MTRVTRGILGGMCLALLMGISGCANDQNTATKTPQAYGVFLSASDSLAKYTAYETVVIDAQYFEAEEIARFQEEGHTVYSYINVGSLENFRDYYEEYVGLTLGSYEHWDEERWVDVSQAQWQEFILDELAPLLMNRGVDGFFVDNCDVYYVYPEEEIYEGLVTIMEGLRAKGLPVILNSGNDFLDTYCERGGDWKNVITGINQESVFSCINWEDNRNPFGTADTEDHEFFLDYIERYGTQGADIYLLEYTTDEKLIAEIRAYCAKMGYVSYIADSIELE